MLKARDIHKKYGSLLVLKGVDINIQEGEIVSIVGSSGAGKSTFLHILGTLDAPDKGTIELDGVPLHTLRGRKLADFRNANIGFVFQFHHLLPEFTALENACIPGWIAKRSKSEVTDYAASLLRSLGLGNRLYNKPKELSGGEQQRVAVARALINQPKIVFADEPTGNLDSASAQDLHELFFELRRQYNQTFLIVTHNNDLARMSDRTLHMKDGKMLETSLV